MAAERTTLGELLYWSYANLAMAHAAVEDGATKYSRKHYMIRARLYKGLREGTMHVGSLLDDERLKMNSEKLCSYCGVEGKLSIDHLVPKSRGGPDRADNAVWACRSCNSSKGSKDLLEWYAAREKFPPLMLLRRYLKLAIEDATSLGIIASQHDSIEGFSYYIPLIPERYPAPSALRLSVED